ncbi:S-norcoclaurine synthase 2 [Cajanus cajan]|uniref:S-norcoclaurine synthase n=1 Tax=Cajanus cajan TaxID=3821 RepID=A0A151TLT9_CAJCA|nr:S-norcoclaurine synthase 2 [Cajanus cajan]KYP68000.1 S-norcoclaurine synthase [Cajanus cajan]
MFGEVEHELELHVPAREAWDLFGGLEIGKLVGRELPELFQKVELIEGDGGLGTVLKLTFAQGVPGPSGYKEKFTKIDNEKRIKETEVVEGGYLELGFTLFRVRFEVIEKGEESSIFKSTIEYEVKEENASNASLVSVQPLVTIAQLAKNYLNKNKHAN